MRGEPSKKPRPLAIWLALTGTNLVALLAVVLLVAAGRRLLGREVPPFRRAIGLLLCASCIVLVAFLVQFNLIGYRI